MQLEKETRGIIFKDGRPRVFGDKEIDELHKYLDSGEYDMRASDFKDEAIVLKKARAIKDLKIKESQVKAPSRIAMERLDDQLGIRDAQKTTMARAIAISDIRNLATFAATVHAILPLINSNLIVNADATHCQTSGDKKISVNAKVYKEREASDPLFMSEKLKV